MKSIINGKRYNTETATEIARDEYPGPCTDFGWWEEILYRAKGGAYFLEGNGGAMSKYARSSGDNSFAGGGCIIPMTDEEARQWCEEHGATAALEEHFSESIQDT